LVQTEEDADLDRMVQESHAGLGQPTAANLQNPEESVSNRVAGSELEGALTRAIKELAGPDRLLVKLYYFDDLRLREAGAVLGVHEATASRRLTRIHAELRKRVAEILIQERGWTKAEAERSFVEIAQSLDTDLETILSNEGIP
jgi:RNA polymerase sigma factor (sigma-70 family)